ncbi:unnamed protein product [Effrenium voratum]|nr:unnamed protein product [Effrenium voratum]
MFADLRVRCLAVNRKLWEAMVQWYDANLERREARDGGLAGDSAKPGGSLCGEASLQIVGNDSQQLLDGEDPRIALLLARTLARLRGESNGFDDAEKEDLQNAFLRFKVPDSADIHKDDLDALLNFVGRWVPPEEKPSRIWRGRSPCTTTWTSMSSCSS